MERPRMAVVRAFNFKPGAKIDSKKPAKLKKREALTLSIYAC
jgi:hypothetical protein